MKKDKSKNYIILIILIAGTILITLVFARIYLNKTKETSTFYNESNKITAKEIKQVSMENPDVIYYISNKYDLNNEEFELEFKLKLEEKNLIANLIYIDTKKSIITKFKDIYKINIDIEKYPIIVFVVDKKIEKIVYVTDDIDTDNLINYEVYE